MMSAILTLHYFNGATYRLRCFMKSFAAIDIENEGNYLKLLSAVSKLSGLFSESAVPFINYRVAENIFCRSFDAGNLSRSDTAFDANYNSIGIGLKTFTCNSNNSNDWDDRIFISSYEKFINI